MDRGQNADDGNSTASTPLGEQLLGLLAMIWSFLQRVVVPSSSVCLWAEEAVLTRMRDGKALSNAQSATLVGCMTCATLYVCCFLVAHIPIVRAAGFLPTSPAPSLPSADVAGVFAGFLDDLARWLIAHPRSIDVLHRLAFTFYFMAAAAYVYYNLAVSLSAQSGLPRDVVALKKHCTWWWAACLQTLTNMVVVTLASFVGYTLAYTPGGVAVMAAWREVDVCVFYVTQSWYCVLLLVYQHRAFGAQEGPSHVQNRLTDQRGPAAFFLIEVRKAALGMAFWFLMFVWLCSPFLVSYVWPAMGGKAPEALASGCRLSWIVGHDSWYSCTVLANPQTHLRMLAFLMTAFVSEFLTLLWGAACWSTAVAGGPDVVQQQQQQQQPAWKRFVAAAGFIALCVLQNVTAIVASLASIHRRQQQPEDANQQAVPEQQQAQLGMSPLWLWIVATQKGRQQAQRIASSAAGQDQQELPQHVTPQQQGVDNAGGRNANLGFATWWSYHRSACCAGMIVYRVYFLCMLGMQGLQVNPFRCRFEAAFFGLATTVHLGARFFTGMMAWCQISYVPHLHQA